MLLEPDNTCNDFSEVRDIVCPSCGGMVMDVPKVRYRPLEYINVHNMVIRTNPNDLYCPKCDIRWMI